MSGEAAGVISARARAHIDACVAKYPQERKQSAVLAALSEVQHENRGYLTTELMDAVAAYLGMARIAVYEVASFYSMFETKPVGRHSVSVCTNISCMLRGADDIVAHIERRCGIKTGDSTSDGRIYLKQEEECLAACCGGPMMMVDHKFYEHLSNDKVDKILDDLT